MSDLIHRITITISQANLPPETKRFFLPMSRSKAIEFMRGLPLTGEELYELGRSGRVELYDSAGNSMLYEFEAYDPESHKEPKKDI